MTETLTCDLYRRREHKGFCCCAPIGFSRPVYWLAGITADRAECRSAVGGRKTNAGKSALVSSVSAFSDSRHPHLKSQARSGNCVENNTVPTEFFCGYSSSGAPTASRDSASATSASRPLTICW